MDEVICDFLGQLCQKFNETYNANLKPDHILEYDLTSFIGEEGKKIFITRGFFKTLRPFPHAVKVINRLQEEGCQIIIASDSKSSQVVEEDKLYWVRKHLPFYPTQKVIFTTEKNLLSGDLIFDDSPDVISKFSGTKVAMDRPYNRHVGDYRIYNNNWRDFYKLVTRIRTNE